MGDDLTTKLTLPLRNKGIDVPNKRVRLTNFNNTKQTPDMTLPPNCQGFGRIRHFKRDTSPGWPTNPLPLDPALHALGLEPDDEVQAQVFQNAVCNWRCWYCYVPFGLLKGDPNHSEMLSAEEIINLYLSEEKPPSIIDLSGGQPDMVPEWIPWMMKELRERGLEQTTYLWSDDNLSTELFWEVLSEEEIHIIKTYPNYGKVCCFKGYDDDSFSFNTGAAPERFEQQFQIFKRALDLNIDLYAYTTFTGPTRDNIKQRMSHFVDRLQDLHTNLPLRTVPLEVAEFGAMRQRVKEEHKTAILNQKAAIDAWNDEINKRFSETERSKAIYLHTLS